MKCKICGNSENNAVYHPREMMMGLRDVFTYFQCSSCQCLQIAEFPDNISKYYTGSYYARRENDTPHPIIRYLKQIRNKYAVFNQSLLGKFLYSKYPKVNLRSLSHLSLKKGMAILDVGCGRGGLLRSLQQLGFTDLTGIDSFNEEKELNIGKGTSIYNKNIDEMQGQWDLIMMHHAFEHMSNPLDVLRNVSRLLSGTGQCLMRIPVTRSLAWRTFRENWVQLDPPRHFFIHSPKSIRHLIEKTDFNLKKKVYDSTAFQFWGSIQYENDIPMQDERSYAENPEKSIFSRQDIRMFAKRAKTLNQQQQGDQAVFILEKEN